MFLRKKETRIEAIPIGLIHPNPYQPRRKFDELALFELADSIRNDGLLQPITVRRLENGAFELIAGERRLRACRIAGLSEVQCIVVDADERRAAVLALIENLQRVDLGFFEEAEAIRRLMNDWGIPQHEVAARLGKAQSTVANKLRLLRLTDEQRKRITAAGLTERHARALLRIVDDDRRDAVLNEIICKGLGVAEAEQLVEETVNPKPEPEPEPSPPPARRLTLIHDYRIYVNTLAKAVDTIRRSGLDARSAETETDEYIEYRVIIPKPSGR